MVQGPTSPVRIENKDIFRSSLFFAVNHYGKPSLVEGNCVVASFTKRRQNGMETTKMCAPTKIVNHKDHPSFSSVSRRIIFPSLHALPLSTPTTSIAEIAVSANCGEQSTERSNVVKPFLDLKETKSSDVKEQLKHILALSPLQSQKPTSLADLIKLAPSMVAFPNSSLGKTPSQNVAEVRTLSVRPRLSNIFSAQEARIPASKPASGTRRSVLFVPSNPLRGLSSLDDDMNSTSEEGDVSSSDKSAKEPEAIVKPLRPILRSSSYLASSPTLPREKCVLKMDSVESDMPSLASSASSDSQHANIDSLEDERLENAIAAAMEAIRVLVPHTSETFGSPSNRTISFDPRVMVREFERSPDENNSAIWYSQEDLESFKIQAVQRVLAYSSVEIVPTGTGRTIQRRVLPDFGKALFTHEALKAENADTEPSCDSVDRTCRLPFPFTKRMRHRHSEQEKGTNRRPEKSWTTIRRVLVVDPYDICLKLFTKSFQKALPTASIFTASSSEEALRLVADNNKFDIILVEERLKLFHRQHLPNDQQATFASGSQLLRRLAVATENQSLLIGVSAHLPEDAQRLKQVGGADFLWAKPPPLLTESLLDDMRLVLQRKRAASKAERQ